MVASFSEGKGANCHSYRRSAVIRIANFGSQLKKKFLKSLKGKHFHIWDRPQPMIGSGWPLRNIIDCQCVFLTGQGIPWLPYGLRYVSLRKMQSQELFGFLVTMIKQWLVLQWIFPLHFQLKKHSYIVLNVYFHAFKPSREFSLSIIGTRVAMSLFHSKVPKMLICYSQKLRSQQSPFRPSDIIFSG
jgi:hypothetical protein